MTDPSSPKQSPAMSRKCGGFGEEDQSDVRIKSGVMNLEGELAEQVDDRAKNLGDNVGERSRNKTGHRVRNLLQNIGQKHTRTPISRTSHMAGTSRPAVGLIRRGKPPYCGRSCL